MTDKIAYSDEIKEPSHADWTAAVARIAELEAAVLLAYVVHCADLAKFESLRSTARNPNDGGGAKNVLVKTSDFLVDEGKP